MCDKHISERPATCLGQTDSLSRTSNAASDLELLVACDTTLDFELDELRVESRLVPKDRVLDWACTGLNPVRRRHECRTCQHEIPIPPPEAECHAPFSIRKDQVMHQHNRQTPVLAVLVEYTLILARERDEREQLKEDRFVLEGRDDERKEPLGFSGRKLE